MRSKGPTGLCLSGLAVIKNALSTLLASLETIIGWSSREQQHSYDPCKIALSQLCQNWSNLAERWKSIDISIC